MKNIFILTLLTFVLFFNHGTAKPKQLRTQSCREKRGAHSAVDPQPKINNMVLNQIRQD